MSLRTRTNITAILGLLAALAAHADIISDMVGEISQSGYTDYLTNSLYTHLGDDRGLSGAEHDLARDNIYDTFAAFGLDTSLHAFQYNGNTYYNVIGVLQGRTNPDDVYIVGAHYDSADTPGADDNGSGVAGVAWDVKIMPVKVMDSEGSGSYYDMIAGINYAVTHNAQVINMSLGGYSYSKPMQDAIDEAYAQGVLVVAAMGNDGGRYTIYPAACSHVMAVASTTNSDARSSFSNYGAHVDIAAPGSSIYSTYMGGGYGYMSGTSMATPFVAGLAGLIYSHYPGYTPDQVARAIAHNADDLGSAGHDDYFGCGRINAYRALSNGAVSSGCSGWGGLSITGVQALDAGAARGVAHRRRAAAVVVGAAAGMADAVQALVVAAAIAVVEALQALAALGVAAATVAIVVGTAAADHGALAVLAGAAGGAVGVRLAVGGLAESQVTLLAARAIGIAQAGLPHRAGGTAGNHQQQGRQDDLGNQQLPGLHGITSLSDST